MSTRSIVARADGEGFSGRYVHWNGYPTYQGETLWRMIKGEFGGDITAAAAALIDGPSAAWSAIDDAANWATYSRRHHPPEEERQRFVPGLGIASADTEVAKVEWHGEEDIDMMDANWVYVLGEEAGKPTLSVLTGEVPPVLIGSFPLDGPEPDWGVVECGAELERCTHVVEAHFPETEGTPAARLSVAKYLGRVEMTPEDAYAVRQGGTEWTFGGMMRSHGGKLERWAEDGRGRKMWLQVAGPGTPVGTELVYPEIAGAVGAEKSL